MNSGLGIRVRCVPVHRAQTFAEREAAVRLFKGILSFVLIVLFLAPAAWGQAGTTSLRGTVTDPKGAVIVGAQVTVTNPATNFSRSTKTDASGQYTFVHL